MIEVQCATCGRSFLGHKCSKRLYCSRKCFFAVPKERNQKPCRQCGKLFETPPSSNKHFCGPECRSAGHRQGTHRLSYTRLHAIWCHMKTRCKCQTSVAYKYYGGRGISVCKEWDESFEAFHQWAIENGYADNLEIDRRNVNGNYEPSNCRWATRSQQMQNTRKRLDAKTSKYRGVSWCANASKWRVQISLKDGRPTHGGLFASEEEAARRYDELASEHFGQFANTNF